MSKILYFFVLCCFNFGCSTADDKPGFTPEISEPDPIAARNFSYLALGDSYTIGESVCESCRFPEQLKAGIEMEIENAAVVLDIIAMTGWTTTNLLQAIQAQNPANDYDLVTLLIGVNNQYQHRPFSVYESEFPELVNKAISLAGGDKNSVIVVSIPDYAFTPYGQSTGSAATISTEIDQYNAFAQAYCEANNVRFVNITDITRMGIENPALVATDGLHPSQLAYSKFVERLLGFAVAAIE